MRLVTSSELWMPKSTVPQDIFESPRKQYLQRNYDCRCRCSCPPAGSGGQTASAHAAVLSCQQSNIRRNTMLNDNAPLVAARAFQGHMLRHEGRTHHAHVADVAVAGPWRPPDVAGPTPLRPACMSNHVHVDSSEHMLLQRKQHSSANRRTLKERRADLLPRSRSASRCRGATSVSAHCAPAARCPHPAPPPAHLQCRIQHI